MRFGTAIIFIWGVSMPLAGAEAPAADVQALQHKLQHLAELVAQLSATVQAQQERIAALEQAGARAVVAQPMRPAATQSLSAFNPEIGVVMDLLGQLSESSADSEGNDKLSARELELVFGHDIDPYSRFDSTITFSDFEDPVIEEAYVTHWGLPGELTARVGRLRPKIGKATAHHRDRLSTVDEPLVVQRYLGLEGLFRTGLELSGFLPVPWTALTHELIGGVMEGGIGEGGTLFGSARRRPSFYARLRNAWDISDRSSLELGTTYLAGSKDADARLEVHALGLDATLVHHLTPTNRLQWQSEAYLQDRAESFSIDADTGSRTDFGNHPWGIYSTLDYQLSPRLNIGGRWDYVQPVDASPADPRNADVAWSGFLTLRQSEFARWRLQYQHAELAGGDNDDRVFLQGTFAIGVHKHQLQ